MKSLRRAVMVNVTALLGIVGLAAAVTAYHFVKYEVNSFQDNALQEVALNVGFVFRDDIEPRIDAELEDQLVVQIWDHDGKLVHRSGPQTEIPFQRDLGYFNVIAGGESWRLFRARDPHHYIQISQRWSAREEVAAYAAAGAVAPLVLAIPIAWLLIGWAVARVIRGLGLLSNDVEQRSAESKEPLPLRDIPVEVTPLVKAVNSLIARHQLALEAQRRFVADAAHELRTPLAAFQIQIDNLAARRLETEERALLDELRAGNLRASHMVKQLLLLARADAFAESELSEVDVRLVISSVASDYRSLADAKGVHLEAVDGDELAVRTRPADLRLLLSNVVDNAVRYTSAGGDIRIVAHQQAGGQPEIEITDTGRGISEDALPFIFDRFFRAVPNDDGGSGLGLSIAKAIADRNSVKLTIENVSDRGGVRALVQFQATP